MRLTSERHSYGAALQGHFIWSIHLKIGIKGIRRVSAVVVTAGAVLTAGAFTAPAQAATLNTPTITAKGGFVMNNGTGSTLFTKAADTRLSTGSTTKIMTARVVLAQPNLNLDSKVTVQKAYSDYIVSKTASSAHLIVGDKVTVRQLLYGLMLPSGCDAAYALADKFGSGSTRAARVKSFIGKMNSTAKGLGLRNTHFDSFDGIGSGGNYSTPRDLTKIASNAMKYSTFRTVVGTKSTKQKVTTKSGGYRYMSWTNTNNLLGSYAGTIGVKTGSGPEAKYCLVFAATRGGKTVIGTVLASSSVANRTADAKKLMDYGFKK
ncbi:D-alanyl-D-alanine carboxypeptidase (penicillin-binding protein 5/6) [Streptomyces sp. 2333.5]|nr:D-alanyl-D-alanine carboxypeptidase (penicillin-binding protein 5/6) [Streptomyces sp. 2333.5]SEE80996.1 D-alanyl-D-alanine carboxypeptidase (penicillin-binding protein 5/6) [Streptomyces sp. 2314.4]SEF02010.1 D-alanyl-D-alanine carboxypeptidase (penicillin-binding protein 5/6) [Streptomyces sp. 2112.2]SOE10005.1 D-alanyl-D-alanine carboxypeptidase (penicillin-binding protein 5/6) [Streptomyces sp. 2323.1]